MEEEWRDVVGYEGWYQVSNLGRIKSQNRFINATDGRIINWKERFKVLAVEVHGYNTTTLYKNCNSKTYLVHRVVAEAFIPNPKNKPQVNHIDFNTTNNCVSNLEWVTPLENTRHYIDNLKGGSLIDNTPRMKPVVQLTKTGVVINKYKSISDAHRSTNISLPNISMSCNNVRKSAGGFVWELE